MRLDLFLKASRLVSRRTVAQQMCDANLVEINGLPAKSARTVKTGDEIILRRHDRTLTVLVLAVPTTKQTPRHDAPGLYEILSDVPAPDD